MATDFFAAQDAARSRSRQLVALFLASVAGLIVAIYLAVMGLLLAGESVPGSLWSPDVFMWVAGLTALVVGVASLGKIASLRAGGGSVARSVGGRLVEAATTDPAERRLVNVVEEMSIAAGVPVPEIYVLDGEDGINAFAAGFAPGDAAVAVTRGCMTKLNRDELQGVVAHEFSHILNGDMRLNIQLIGLVFGLLVLAIIGQGMMRVALQSGGGRRRGGKDGAAIIVAVAAMGLILFVAGWLGVLFGRLLQSAVSRQREFLADAAAVQFTRNPDGLSGALRKIGASGSRVNNAHSQDVAHLFFANGLRLGWAGMFATHPPLEERIRAIDPGWDGSFAKPPPLPRAEPAPPPLPSATGAGAAAALAAAAVASGQLAQAQAIREELSALLGDDWRDPSCARDLVLALLPPMPSDADTAGVQDYREKLSLVEPGRRLALVGMLMPALGRLPEGEREDLLRQLGRLGGEGAALDAFDFGVWWIVRRDLGRLGCPPKPPGKLGSGPAAFAPDVAVLVASLAHVGAENDEAVRSFESAVAHSPSFGPLCRYPGQWPDVAQLDQALQNLGAASFALRKEIIDSASRAVVGDGKVTASEAALMQVVSLALDCPAPLTEASG